MQVEAPELPLALAKRVGREVAPAGPAGDGADLNAEELGGAIGGQDLPAFRALGVGGRQGRERCCRVQNCPRIRVGRLLPAHVRAAHFRARPVGRGQGGGTNGEPFALRRRV